MEVLLLCSRSILQSVYFTAPADWAVLSLKVTKTTIWDNKRKHFRNIMHAYGDNLHRLDKKSN